MKLLPFDSRAIFYQILQKKTSSNYRTSEGLYFLQATPQMDENWTLINVIQKRHGF